MSAFERSHDRLSFAVAAVCERLDGDLGDGTARDDYAAALLVCRTVIGALQDRASRLVEAVQEEHERCEQAFDDAASALVITDRVGLALRANAAAGRVFDRDPAALAGLSLVHLAPLEYRTWLLQALAGSTTIELNVPLANAADHSAIRARIRALPKVSGTPEYCWQIWPGGKPGRVA